MLEWGFEHMFAHWNSAELADFCIQEIPGFDPAHLNTFINADTCLDIRQSLVGSLKYHRLFLVTASTVPSAAFQDIVLALLLPIEVVVRPSENLVPLFRDLHQYLTEITPLLAQRLRIVETGHCEDSLIQWMEWCDCINISGSNTTIEYYKDLLSQHSLMPKIIPHGHRVSVAVIRSHESDILTSQDYHHLSLDLTVWDQMGCLSPKCILIEDNLGQCEKIAQHLSEYLDEWARSLPEGVKELEVEVQKNSAVQMAMLDGAKVIRCKKNDDVLVIHSEMSEFEPVFLPRFTHIYPVRDCVEAAIRLSPYGQAFGSLSMCGDEITSRLKDAGYNYFCRFGRMQDPPLTWLHDSVGTLLPLYS